MIIDVPDELVNDFMRFLDVAQASFTEEEIAGFAAGERRVLTFVECLLKGERSMRWQNRREREEATRAFQQVCGLGAKP